MRSYTRKLALAGFFVAMDIISARFLYFYLPDPLSKVVRVSPQFLAHALAGWLLGPLWAAGSAVAGDWLGMLINSGGLAIHWGFTLSAALTGLIYGLFLYRRDIRWIRAAAAVLAVVLPVSLLLGSVWMSQIKSLPVHIVLLEALPWRLLTIPVYTGLLCSVQKGLRRSAAGLYGLEKS